jgi:hypothetical protein
LKIYFRKNKNGGIKMVKRDDKGIKIISVVSFLIGVVIMVLVSVGYSLTRDDKMSESGITILFDVDGVVRVPKGTVIKGNAIEVVNLDESFTKSITTPYEAERSMLVKCSSGSDSVCILYTPGKYGVDYPYEALIKKILK